MFICIHKSIYLQKNIFCQGLLSPNTINADHRWFSFTFYIHLSDLFMKKHIYLFYFSRYIYIGGESRNSKSSAIYFWESHKTIGNFFSFFLFLFLSLSLSLFLSLSLPRLLLSLPFFLSPSFSSPFLFSQSQWIPLVTPLFPLISGTIHDIQLEYLQLVANDTTMTTTMTTTTTTMI